MKEDVYALIRKIEQSRTLIIEERYRRKAPVTEIEAIALSTLTSVQLQLEKLFKNLEV